jgi:acetyl-CoA synthetase
MAEKQLSGEVYYPTEEVKNFANANCDEIYKSAVEDYEGFWSKEAENLHWFDKWNRVVDDSSKPFYKWYIDGKTNICYNCLDVHLDSARRNKLALIWEGEKGEFRSWAGYRSLRLQCLPVQESVQYTQ